MTIAPGIAMASPETTSEDDAIAETARSLYEEAHAAREAQKWSLCHAKASAAWAIHKHPKIAAAAGDCALYLGRAKEAAEHLAFYLEHKKPDAPATTVAYFEKRFREAASQIAIIRVRINVTGARIRLGDAGIDPARPLYLEPGSYELHAEHAGYQPLAQPLATTAGQDAVVSLKLLPVNVRHGNGELSSNGDTTATLLWTALGVGTLSLVGVGVGVGLTVATNHKADEIDTMQAAIQQQSPSGCTDTISACRDLDEALGSKDTLHNAALGVWIGAGSLALIAGALAIAGASQPSGASSLQITPRVALGEIGLDVSLGF
jgi:hypothetical protein